MNLDLFDIPVAQGKTDTSREAATKMEPKAPTLRQQVYSAIFDSGLRGATTSEIAKKLNRNLLGVRPRATELQGGGFIEDSGERRMNAWGNNEIVWRVSE